MRKTIYYNSFIVLIVFTAVLSLSFFSIAFAQDSTSYKLDRGIVPCGNEVDAGGILTNPCNLCSLYGLAKNTIDFLLFYFILPVAGIALLIGGILLLTSRGNEQQLSSGKAAIYNTVIGVVIAFAAWLIVGTLLNTLGFQNFGGESFAWNKFPECKDPVVSKGPGPINPPASNELRSCSVNNDCKIIYNTQELCASQCAQDFPGGTCVTSSQCEKIPPPPSPGSGTLTEVNARKRLNDSGIPVNKNPCPAGIRYQDVSGGCTSLQGIRESTVNEVIRLKQVCSCNIIVTGGTEFGHAGGEISHAAGFKIDLGTGSIDDHIINTYRPAGTRGSDPRYINDSTGVEYVLENNPPHWDITVP